MFWGGIIKEGQPLKSQKLLETSEFAVLHLSAAVLTSVDSKKTMLFAKQGKDPEVCIAVLSAGHEMFKLDHYINCTQNVSLLAKGPGEVHLSGYFEPKGDDMDDDMFYGQEEADDAEEESDEEEAPKSKALSASLNAAKVNSSKNASQVTAHDDDEDDSEIEEDMSDLEDEEGEDEIDLKKAESDSDSDDVPVPVKKSQKAAAVIADSDEEEEEDDEDDKLADDDSDDDSEEIDLKAIMAKAQAAKKPSPQ